MEKKYYAHETAVVDEGAQIGEGTKIWHFSHIRSGAVIGKDCSISQNCYVDDKAVLGDGVKLQNNVSVYAMVTLEDGVFAGPSMVFTNDINPRAPYPKGGKWVSTKVKKGATLGANSTIVCGNTVGKWAMVAAGAVVTKDVPDYALVMGVPASIKGWICECGTNLTFSTDKDKHESCICVKCGRKFDKSGYNVSEIK
ncbi:N-acetyltransferase [candidate division WOR-3 bacterium]|nr:N-acetyltransferase [candidate division WOR-3 bacterium]